MNGELSQYAKLIPFLGEILGTSFEACLYDLTDPAYPVVAAANSYGDNQEQTRAFISEMVASQRVRARGYFTNRPIAADFGKMLKASVFFIHSTDSEIIGALCLNVRCDLFMKMVSFASDMLRFNMEDVSDDVPEPEFQDTAAHEPSLDTIAEVVKGFGIEPSRASQDERLEIICDLYDMGVFRLKGAVAKTAAALHISEQSVYRYLTKIKRSRD